MNFSSREMDPNIYMYDIFNFAEISNEVARLESLNGSSKLNKNTVNVWILRFRNHGRFCPSLNLGCCRRCWNKTLTGVLYRTIGVGLNYVGET